jgi:hypothetical protein
MTTPKFAALLPCGDWTVLFPAQWSYFSISTLTLPWTPVHHILSQTLLILLFSSPSIYSYRTRVLIMCDWVPTSSLHLRNVDGSPQAEAQTASRLPWWAWHLQTLHLKTRRQHWKDAGDHRQGLLIQLNYLTGDRAETQVRCGFLAMAEQNEAR